jgi:hypothetical protein
MENNRSNTNSSKMTNRRERMTTESKYSIMNDSFHKEVGPADYDKADLIGNASFNSNF